MRKTKNGVVWITKTNFAMHSNFRYIAKIRYDSKDSEFSNVAKFWHCSLATVPLLLTATRILHAWNDSTNLALKACKNCKINHKI